MATGAEGGKKGSPGYIKQEMRGSRDGHNNRKRTTSSNSSSSSSRRTSLTGMTSDRGGESSAVCATAESKVDDQETLREELSKLVRYKLSALGPANLDSAGLAALEALSKLPPIESKQPSAIGAAGGGITSTSSADRPAKRNLPSGLEKVKKFSGKDPHSLTDTLNQFHSLVVAALPDASPGTINKALTRDVMFVLEGAALKFFTSLKAGEIQWQPASMNALSTEGSAQQMGEERPRGGKGFRPPSTWAELCEALHDHYLPLEGIARTTEKLLSLSQAPDESVSNLAHRQIALHDHMHHLIKANGGQTSYWEAMAIRVFERALRADLQRLHDTEPPCSTFNESVHRAEHNARRMAKKKGDKVGLDDGTQQDSSNNGAVPDRSGASSATKGPITVPAAQDGVVDNSEDGDNDVTKAAPGALSAGLPRHVKESLESSELRNDRGPPTGATAGDGQHSPVTARAVSTDLDEHVRESHEGSLSRNNRSEPACATAGHRQHDTITAPRVLSAVSPEHVKETYEASKLRFDGDQPTGDIAGYRQYGKTAAPRVLSTVLPGHVKAPLEGQNISGWDRPASATAGRRKHDGARDGSSESENIGVFSEETLSDDGRVGQEAGDISSKDRSRHGSVRRKGHKGGGSSRGGKGGVGPGNDHSRKPGNNNSRELDRSSRTRKGKRGRDPQENNTRDGAHHAPPPRQRARNVDPADEPPCTNPKCKTINRQFHSTNGCFFHPERGQLNRERAGRRNNHSQSRPPPIREDPVQDPSSWQWEHPFVGYPSSWEQSRYYNDTPNDTWEWE